MSELHAWAVAAAVLIKEDGPVAVKDLADRVSEIDASLLNGDSPEESMKAGIAEFSGIFDEADDGAMVLRDADMAQRLPMVKAAIDAIDNPPAEEEEVEEEDEVVTASVDDDDEDDEEESDDDGEDDVHDAASPEVKALRKRIRMLEKKLEKIAQIVGD
jgi:hypothetical protein